MVWVSHISPPVLYSVALVGDHAPAEGGAGVKGFGRTDQFVEHFGVACNEGRKADESEEVPGRE